VSDDLPSAGCISGPFTVPFFPGSLLGDVQILLNGRFVKRAVAYQVGRPGWVATIECDFDGNIIHRAGADHLFYNIQAGDVVIFDRDGGK
jgi:hypothetical protein